MKHLMRRPALYVVFLAVMVHVTGGSAFAQKAPAHKSPHKDLKRSCDDCHTATSFTDIRFDHGETGFELSGSHANGRCLDCHNIENFSRVEATCATCHQDMHRGRLGVECERCHTDRGWTVFDAESIHEATNFPLQGRHLLVDCLACHPGMPTADFRRIWNSCYSCHQGDYEATTNPDHRASGFSTLCQTCHEMTGWTPSIMADHDAYFPIYSGTHNRRWDTCSDCHVVPGNFRVFECINCHQHDRPEMDSRHQGISGYAYNSPACYQCHPTGEAGEFGEHDVAFFPIYSGRHKSTWDSCSDCHVTPGNFKLFECVNCHQHDRLNADLEHQGVSGYGYTSAQCYECHPTGEAGDFLEHDAAYFPIYSGRHNNTWDSCSTCHQNPSNRKEFTCLNCHAHDRTTTDGQHQGEVRDYAYNSARCYECHPTGRAEGN